MERIHFKPGETQEFFLFFLFLWVLCLYACLHTIYMLRTYGGQKMTLNALELELDSFKLPCGY